MRGLLTLLLLLLPALAGAIEAKCNACQAVAVRMPLYARSCYRLCLSSPLIASPTCAVAVRAAASPGEGVIPCRLRLRVFGALSPRLCEQS